MSGTLERGESVSPEAETARAYLTNPGHGGDTMWTCEIDRDTARVLDSRSGHCEDMRAARRDMIRLARLSGVDEEEAASDWAHCCPSTGQWLAMHDDVVVALARDYDWLVLHEDYPSGGETWVYLGERPIEMQRLPEGADE
jgi:hypothetical protein